jgi:hypothetical protein
LKIFSGGYTPGPPFKGRGGKERKGRTEGEKRGLGTQLGRSGVAWVREGEEGMRVIQRKGKGREEGREEGRRRKMTWPPQKIPGSATGKRSGNLSGAGRETIERERSGGRDFRKERSGRSGNGNGAVSGL